jgi:hypothetical protein
MAYLSLSCRTCKEEYRGMSSALKHVCEDGLQENLEKSAF